MPKFNDNATVHCPGDSRLAGLIGRVNATRASGKVFVQWGPRYGVIEHFESELRAAPADGNLAKAPPVLKPRVDPAPPHAEAMETHNRARLAALDKRT